MQKLFRFLVRLLIPVIARVEVHGYENLPQGGFIVAANHLGRLDTVMLYFASDREDIIMPVAEKYEHHWLFGPLMRSLGGFFINRFNADIGAVRQVLSRIKEGGVFVIAPEGTRSKTEALQEAHSGAAFFASKTGLPIVPVALAGTEDRRVIENLKQFRRSHIVVRVGKSLTIPPVRGKDHEAELRGQTDEIMCRIAVMLPEKNRGVYANHPKLRELLPEDA